MEIQFLIGKKIVYKKKTNFKKEDLFQEKINSDNAKFKIPLNRNYHIDYDESSFSDDSSDSFDVDEIDDDEDKLELNSVDEGSKTSEGRKLLRGSGLNSNMDEFYSLYDNKKQKKELTEDEIMKKNEQMLKRKMHAKRMVEEEKRQAIEKILNEDGRKLKERQKKLNEELIKKQQQEEEKLKISLTKIKHKYLRDGKIYVRFPQGLLLPQVLRQSNKSYEKPKVLCQVNDCTKEKKYLDPKSKKYYCSVACYKLIS